VKSLTRYFRGTSSFGLRNIQSFAAHRDRTEFHQLAVPHKIKT
jgi:hypothetical protein